MFLPAHGIAQDDRHPIRVQEAGRVAVILQRLVTGGYGPLLDLIDLFLDAGWDGDPHFGGLEGETAHPAADLAVGLIRGGRVGVVEKLRFPAVSSHIGDRIPAGLDVLPKCLHVRRIRQDGAQADDGDGWIFTHNYFLFFNLNI